MYVFLSVRVTSDLFLETITDQRKKEKNRNAEVIQRQDSLQHRIIIEGLGCLAEHRSFRKKIRHLCHYVM